jgi:N-acetyl-anhydromuramyl-L-alanine amidase AmpD
VDCDSIVQGVPDDRVAWHAPGANRNGIGIEHAGFVRQSKADWLDEFGSRMLSLSAELAARLCVKWHIPPVFVSAGELLAKRRGITTHMQVTQAFHRSSHTDPGGNFPLSWYLARVDAALRYKESNA